MILGCTIQFASFKLEFLGGERRGRNRYEKVKHNDTGGFDCGACSSLRKQCQ